MKEKKTTLKYKVHSLERGLELLELLALGAKEKTLTELCRESGFTTGTAHRILDALEHRGYLMRNPSTLRYRPSFKLAELARASSWQKDLQDVSMPILDEIAYHLKETTYLIIIDNDEAYCLDRTDGNTSVRILTLEIGARMALHLGAAPRVLMAYLPTNEIDRIIREKGLESATPYTITNPLMLKQELRTIREQGYSVSFHDVTEGVAAVGSPVRNWQGKVIAAVSIAGLASSNNFKKESIPLLVETIKNASDKISEILSSNMRITA